MNHRMKYCWIVWYAILIHILWGILLLTDSSTGNVTAVHSLDILFSDNRLTGIVVLTAGFMALIGILKKGIVGLGFLIPQQFLLIISGLGAINAVWSSSFADGVLRPRAFILADQSPAILACILHTFAILQHHAGTIWKRVL